MHLGEREPVHAGWRILIAGTGGQGVLTAARLLCDCFVARGHHVVSGQLHGMAQRGGAVQSSVIIDGGISPAISSARADFVLGFEPVETARALPFMSSRTTVYMNTAPVVPFVLAQRLVLKQPGAEYPDVQQLADRIRATAPRTFSFDATQCALEAGAAKALNMVMLGWLLGSDALPCTAEDFWQDAAQRMPAALRQVNTKAFMRGAALAAEIGAGGVTS
jgi:indolepyruvate ferredoxin oxidoreductase beta subunit